MSGRGKYFHRALLFTFLNVGVLLSQNIRVPEEIIQEKRTRFIIDYLYSTFPFTSVRDKQTFLNNQRTILHFYRDDCSIAYRDVGSHDAFLTYVHGCTHSLYDARYRFLLDQYVCKVTQMSGEKCSKKSDFEHYLNAYITYISKPKILSLIITPKTLITYNNIAYYLQKAGDNKEAVYLLEKIIAKFPNRTVAYYNLGDAYWVLGKKQKAINAYHTYIRQMQAKGLAKKIPKTVWKRADAE